MSLSQTITPELRQWIIDQASAGVAAPALIVVAPATEQVAGQDGMGVPAARVATRLPMVRLACLRCFRGIRCDSCSPCCAWRTA